MEDLEIPVTAELPGHQITARRLATLKIGDMLDFDHDPLTQVQLRLADLHKFSGRLGTRSGKWAIEVTKVMRS